MKSAVIVFPGSNCDRDLAVAIEQVTGRAPAMVWHRETELPEGTGLAMQMLRLCANAGESVDGYMISLIRFCKASGISTDASLFLRREPS